MLDTKANESAQSFDGNCCFLENMELLQMFISEMISSGITENTSMIIGVLPVLVLLIINTHMLSLKENLVTPLG